MNVVNNLLREMYLSVERLNLHIINNNPAGVVSEQALQENLRNKFELVLEEDIDAKE